MSILARLLQSTALMAFAPPDERGASDEPEIGTGAGSEGTAGTDNGDDQAGDDEPELPAEHADDGEDDGEPGDEVEEAPPSRGARRQQTLANERRELRQRLETTERERATERAELEALRRDRQSQQHQLTQQQEAERLALMTPDERLEYRMTQHERRTQQTMQQTLLQMQAASDKTSYDAKAMVNPVYKKHSVEVERVFQRQLAEGRPVDRELILKNILGELALASADRATNKARTNGARRVNAQRVNAGNTRSDNAGSRGPKPSTLEQRLANQLI